MSWLHVVTFLSWTGGVAVLTCICCRHMRTSLGAVDNYFAGGRALPWYVVAGSLLLTNVSTEQLVGLNGVVFMDGCLAASAWETFAALAMCLTALFFLPRYMQLGLTMTTSFLGERFDFKIRTVVSGAFLIFYSVCLCPSVLYTGSLAIQSILGLDGSLPLWIICLTTGAMGACYAVIGGLKAVAVSDCFNGLGLLIVSLWVPLAALLRIGGLMALFEEPDVLMPFVRTSHVFDPAAGMRSVKAPTLPWDVMLTGLLPLNLFYWSMNPVVVQRALAAKSLAEGQKGVLFAATMKIVGFVAVCLPGVLVMLLIQRRAVVDGQPFVVRTSDQVYPQLVKAVMPKWSYGFRAAVFLGCSMSSYNAGLNSSSTLFALEVYKVYINPEASEERTVRVGALFGIALAVPSWIIAPQLQHCASVLDLMGHMGTLVSVPVMALFIVGISTTLPDGFAAKVGFIVGTLAYGSGMLVQTNLHHLTVLLASVMLAVAAMVLTTHLSSLRRCFRETPWPTPRRLCPAPVVDIAEWPWTRTICASVVALVLLLTVSLQTGRFELFVGLLICWAATVSALATLTTMDIKDELELPKAPFPVMFGAGKGVGEAEGP